MNKKSVKAAKAPNELKEFTKQCTISSSISIVIAAALLCVTAVVLVKIDVPFELHQPLTTIITALSTLVSTYIMGKKREKTGLGMGVSVGGLVFLVLFLISAIFGDKVISMQSLIKLAALISAGGLGGMVGVNKALSAKKPKAYKAK